MSRYFLKKAFTKIGKLINFFIIKRNNRIYVEPHINCKTDCYDLLNSNGDNSLKVINYFVRNNVSKKSRVYIEYYDKSRLKVLVSYSKNLKNNNVKIKFILSCWNQKGLLQKFKSGFRYIRNHLIRYSSKIWICDTGWAHFFDKLKSQKIINFNYCTPFKEGGLYDDYFSYKHIDFICETSDLCSEVVSKEYHAPLSNFVVTGFPRNDSIFYTDKSVAVVEWLKEKGILGKKIVLYVPTYRNEYIDFSKKNIFGFEDNGALNEILDAHNAVIITKLHPLQRKNISSLPNDCIDFVPNYKFSVYDLFGYADLMISDYSSISTDFLISKKPVIYLFSDFDKYKDSRGFSFKPIQSMCCGDVCYIWDELKCSIDTSLNEASNHCFDKVSLWHKYIDSNSTERCYDLLMGLLK